jgi:hypothetical protein
MAAKKIDMAKLAAKLAMLPAASQPTKLPNTPLGLEKWAAPKFSKRQVIPSTGLPLSTRVTFTVKFYSFTLYDIQLGRI